MSPGEIANAAFGLALLQAEHDNVDPYEMLGLLIVEASALLMGQDLENFGAFLNGLGVCAGVRRSECMGALLTGQPPAPLSWPFARGVSVH
jgi:uncharacterized membrane protein